MTWTTIGKNDIPVGESKCYALDGVTSIIVFNVKGKFYALENKCSHVGAPLSEGTLSKTTLTCAFHGAQFDVTTGTVLAWPATKNVKSYPVRIENDELQVDVI